MEKHCLCFQDFDPKKYAKAENDETRNRERCELRIHVSEWP